MVKANQSNTRTIISKPVAQKTCGLGIRRFKIQLMIIKQGPINHIDSTHQDWSVANGKGNANRANRIASQELGNICLVSLKNIK
jgi:hypothetical protein